MTYHVGDTAPALTGRLTTAGVPKDVTGATLEVHIAKPDATVLTRAATVTAALTGDWSMAWQTGDLAQAGGYRVEVQVTYSNTTLQTFGYEWFTVEPQIA